jgi:hypothetical protein
MTNTRQLHSFYIPVMGTSFTIDTPIRLAHKGISSVISITDDGLIESVRKFYAQKLNLPYEPILKNDEDARARRITAYLDMVKEVVEGNFDKLMNDSPLEGLGKYAQLLPKNASEMMSKAGNKAHDISDWLKEIKEQAIMGSIDVNIMTKLDKVNYKAGKALSKLYNDAHAALRGFAQSKLSSSIILSAGLNPSLMGYMQEFEDFFPATDGTFKKKVILKVSDYRSALIQGKYLAKNGIWVSEFRIESGLNCGGHAFATDGLLFGPILEEFRDKREELRLSLMELYEAALTRKEKSIPTTAPTIRITAQGGVGTAEEHEFLLDYYKLDAIGWGSPFLLVPEATCVDQPTRNQLALAEEKDLYLSKISPLGVPFNNLRNNSKDVEKFALIESGRPGVPCTNEYLQSNTEFTEKAICTASKKYQKLKIEELSASGLSSEALEKEVSKVTEKACICTGLGTPFYLEHNLTMPKAGPGISICPGPNMAYYSREFTLQEMVDHIYGRKNVITRTDRPSVFIKDLQLYLNYFQDQVQETLEGANTRAIKKMEAFANNLQDGLTYYQNLQTKSTDFAQKFGDKVNQAMSEASIRIEKIKAKLLVTH